jgi:hypothetical protein
MGDQAVLPKSDLERLVELARLSEPVQLDVGAAELTTGEMMKLAESGGAFEFWKEPGEDIYSLQDGEAL